MARPLVTPVFASAKTKAATSLSDTYVKVVDYAVGKAQLGAESYSAAVKEIIDAMSRSGIRTVDYASGYSRRLDSSVRQNVLWGIKQFNQNMSDQIGEDFGADGYEISYHSHPRPSHEEMGGKQYAIGRARTVKGVKYPSFEAEAEPLLNDYGCLHFKYPILLGISAPAYDKNELAAFKASDKQKFEFEGKEYTPYEASQVQRQLETAIRTQKDKAVMAKTAGKDEIRQEAQRRINQLTAKYADFSKASGLPTQVERLNVKGFSSVKISEKAFTNGKKGDIIKKTGAVPASRYVNSADTLFKNAKNIKPISGYEDIVIHGDRFGFEVRNKDGRPAYTYTVREFAEILKTDPTYTGGAIRLISCEAGAIDNGAAQMLANQLGVNVLAPSDIIWVYPDGEIIIGPEPSKNIGAWRLFKPKGK